MDLHSTEHAQLKKLVLLWFEYNDTQAGFPFYVPIMGHGNRCHVRVMATVAWVVLRELAVNWEADLSVWNKG